MGVWGDVSPGALGGSLGRCSPRCTGWESGETFPQVHCMGGRGDVPPGALGGSWGDIPPGALGGSLGRRLSRCTGWESGDTFPQVHRVGVWGDVYPGALGGSLGRRSPRCTGWESGETFTQVHWVGVWGHVPPGVLGGSLGTRSPRCTGWESGETFPQVHWVGVWGDVPPGALGGSLGRRLSRCTGWESGETSLQVYWVGVWGHVPPGALGGSLGRRFLRCTGWEGRHSPRCTGWKGRHSPRCTAWESGETFTQVHWVGVWGDVSSGALGGSLGRCSPRKLDALSHNTIYCLLSGSSIPKPVGPPDKNSVQLIAGEGASISCKVPMQMNTKLGICFAPVGENLTSLNRSKSCVECNPYYIGLCKGSIATKPGWQVARSTSNTAACMTYQITNLTIPKVQESDRGTVYCYWSTSSEVGGVYQMDTITVLSDSWIDQNWEYLVVGGVGVPLVLVVLLCVVSIASCYITARRRRIKRLMDVADYPTENGRGDTKRHADSNHNTGWHDLSIHLSIIVICLT